MRIFFMAHCGLRVFFGLAERDVNRSSKRTQNFFPVELDSFHLVHTAPKICDAGSAWECLYQPCAEN